MTEQLTIPEDKKQNWLNAAQKSFALDASLSAKQNAIIATLADLPTESTTEAISIYEATLKKTKQDIAELEMERKQFTTILDKITTNKMQYEKTCKAAITPYEASLLTCKLTHKKATELTKAKTDEENSLRERFANHITSERARMEIAIVNQIAATFEAALKTKMQPENIPTYLIESANPFGTDFFKVAKYAQNLIYITKEEAGLIMRQVVEANPINPDELLGNYQSALAEKFSFYSISLKNAEDAIELSKAEQAKTLAAIETESTNTQISNKLQATAVPLATVAGPKTKALKSVWGIDMPDDKNTALTILAAFMANFAVCEAKIRITIWSNLSVTQMRAALIAIKNEDEKFEVSGIVFKEGVKL